MKKSRAATIFGRCAIAMAIVLIACGLWFWVGYKKFHNRLKELKANGSLILLEEIVHEVADPQKDALTFLKQTFPIANDYAKTIQRDSLGKPEVGAEPLRRFAEFNSRHPEFFQLISAAASSPEMSFGLDPSRSYGILDVQNVLLVMDWKGRILLSEGDQPGAIKLAQEMLQLSQLVEKRFMLGALLGRGLQIYACNLILESLMIAPIDPETKKQIRQLLMEFDLDAVHENALRGELSLFVNHLAGSNPQNGSTGFQTLLAPLNAFTMPVAYGNRYLDQMDTAFARANQPLSIQFSDEKRSSWRILPDPIGDSTELYNNSRNHLGHAKVWRQCVLLLLYLTSESDSTNRTEWTNDYLQSIGATSDEVTDPYSGQPLIIRRNDDRWAIYSVGPNRRDDQGQRGTDDIGWGSIPISK